jgi:hypothetical protein
MNLSSSSHAAGRAAYTRSTTPPQESPQSTSSTDDTESASSPSEPQDTALQKTAESDLTTQEQRMIEEKFPEDQELSMRLYGRGRGAKTVSSNSVGGNLDVTG